MLNQPIKPMLLQASPTVITKKGWIHNLKWDGFRVLIHYDNGQVRAWTREGNEITSRFPELQQIHLNCKSAILDGECICLDESSKPYWEDAMIRLLTKNISKIKQLAKIMPAHFPVWDIIYLDGKDLTRSSLMNRLESLQKIVNASNSISVTTTHEDGSGLFQKVKEMGLEGIVSKYVGDGVKSYYYLDSRPQNVWIKTKAYLYDEFYISGLKKKEFGWSLSNGKKHVGVIEFPPSSDVTKAFFRVAKGIVKGETKDWIQIEPVLKCKVKFQAYTRDGKLRSPVFEEFVFQN